MWRHSPHHIHARCREISDFSTSVIVIQKSENSPHDGFFPQIPEVLQETNTSYGIAPRVPLSVQSLTDTVSIC